ncbi:MAG TPA: response regulator transcription factor [Nocardioidaceae bacterium]|nr:response regulator transcription factor [Nocardioidaceae bacterium]
MKRILVIEDEPRIASFVAKGLRSAGFTPTTVGDGREGLDHALSGEFDLAILDIGLPSLDGFALLEQLRGAGSKLPVIALTARDSVSDTVRGLEGGADDYMPKPFRFDELLARVRLRLRDRSDTTATGGAGNQNVLEHRGVRLDLHRREATRDGATVELSAREFALAEMFLRHPDQVLSREQLLSHVWGYEFDPGSNVVDVYVGYLRKKLGSDVIRTVRGMGYRLD